MITQKELKSYVSYDKDSGDFTWTGSLKRTKKGSKPGCKDNYGYTVFKIKGRTYKAHRLAWLYENGDFPEGEIDHINRVKTDNRIQNLRVCNTSQNLRNRDYSILSSTGSKGVYPSGSKYRVRVSVLGKVRHFGTFEDLELAELVASEVRRIHHGDFCVAN